MMNEKIDIPVWEKYTLTIEEASRYFTIDVYKRQAFKGCSSLEKISVLPRIYHN